jgi:uncharacterized membrane protein YfcA
MSDFAAFLLPAGVSSAAAALLVAVSFFTSALTAAFGIGGGVAMLGALASAAPPATIIAVHGVVQLGSNLGRAIVQRRHAVWRLVGLFALGSVVGVAVGAWLVVALPTRLLLGALGVFILAMVWLPKPRIPGLERSGMVLGGLISSVLTMFVGATGPFIQSVLLGFGLDKKALVATHAVAMAIQHGLKALAFGLIGFSFRDWWPLLAAMIASGFLGTLLGTALLERLPERWFRIAIQTILTVLALDLLRRATFGD